MGIGLGLPWCVLRFRGLSGGCDCRKRNGVWVVMSLLGWRGPADAVSWIAGPMLPKLSCHGVLPSSAALFPIASLSGVFDSGIRA